MKWFIGLLVAYLAFDTFFVRPLAATRVERKSVQIATVQNEWPQLPPRKEFGKGRRSYSSFAGVQRGGSGR
jgi:hypothetical protein